ncbi:MAG: DUF1669 domain-containing protein [bacterium]|nr:DUF1669 domain-containing protein [bacterium]
MDTSQIDAILEQTLADLRLSRSERSALDEILAEYDGDARQLEVVRSRAFELARSRLGDSSDVAVLGWLEAVIRSIESAQAPQQDAALAEAWFSPHSDCAGRIMQLVERSQKSIEVCVFTITDDRITHALLESHARGTDIRIITDDMKAGDLGSDINDLAEAGIPLATDNSSAHMHNKFAIFDGTTVITGSYNWTRTAARANQENLIVTDDRELVRRFSAEFDRLWRAFHR